MKVLIDIGHPAHVHLFKNFAWEFQEKGHEILFTVREKEHEIYLLKLYGFRYISFGKHFKSKAGKLYGLFHFNFYMLKAAFSFKPDIFLSHGSLYAAQIAFVFKKPHISLEDTGNMEQVRLYLPFTKTVLTSIAFHKDLGKKQIRYNSYHELAYLHTNIFSGDKNISKVLGLKENERFFVIRFVSWNATHDYRQKGLSFNNKRDIIEKLNGIGKVFISSESVLPTEFERYQLKVSPEKIHDVLAAADLFIGEGATMSSESVILGTPAIYINSIEAGTIDEQEHNGLLFHFRNFDGVLDKINEVLTDPLLKENCIKKRIVTLENKINLTSFLTWFVEDYPMSERTMKENPQYQNRFI
jgi:predicted glycosyltransferase